MKPQVQDSAWQKLVAAARRAPDERATTAPYGFATRVAALALAAERRPFGSLFERFSWRALGVAALLAIGSVAADYASLSKSADDDGVFDETAVTSVFDVAGT